MISILGHPLFAKGSASTKGTKVGDSNIAASYTSSQVDYGTRRVHLVNIIDQMATMDSLAEAEIVLIDPS